MNGNNKRLPIPKGLDDIMVEMEAYRRLRDIYTKLPFGFRKAVKCGKQAEKKRREFWQKVFSLYPVTSKGSWVYLPTELMIEQKEEEDEVVF